MAVSQHIGFIMKKMAWALTPSKRAALHRASLVAMAIAATADPASANALADMASDSEADTTIFVIGPNYDTS
jgi:geranylgeranyl pyrophosphate synthase